jgi:hypothetical protein
VTTSTLVGGLAREQLLDPPAPNVRVAGLRREALLDPPPPNLRVGRLVRESLVAGTANTFVRSAALVREVLLRSPQAVFGGLAREALLQPVPPYVFVSGMIREVLLGQGSARRPRPVLFIVT